MKQETKTKLWTLSKTILVIEISILLVEALETASSDTSLLEEISIFEILPLDEFVTSK